MRQFSVAHGKIIDNSLVSSAPWQSQFLTLLDGIATEHYFRQAAHAVLGQQYRRWDRYMLIDLCSPTKLALMTPGISPRMAYLAQLACRTEAKFC
jgi:hypothetical protein